MNYEPQVGDRVRIAPHGDEGDVLFAYRRQAVVKLDCDIDAGLYGFSELAKVVPRPMIAECVGYISAGDGFNHAPAADTAAFQAEHKFLTPARIVAKTWEELEDIERNGAVAVAVVCDLDGNPLEVQR